MTNLWMEYYKEKLQWSVHLQWNLARIEPSTPAQLGHRSPPSVLPARPAPMLHLAAAHDHRCRHAGAARPQQRIRWRYVTPQVFNYLA
jgi:hypothetical protein